MQQQQHKTQPIQRERSTPGPSIAVRPRTKHFRDRLHKLRFIRVHTTFQTGPAFPVRMQPYHTGDNKTHTPGTNFGADFHKRKKCPKRGHTQQRKWRRRCEYLFETFSAVDTCSTARRFALHLRCRGNQHGNPSPRVRVLYSASQVTHGTRYGGWRPTGNEHSTLRTYAVMPRSEKKKAQVRAHPWTE